MNPAIRTAAQTFPADVARDIRSLTANGEADRARKARQDRLDAEAPLASAWQAMVEKYGRCAALETLAEAEEGVSETARELFLSLSTQTEAIGI